MNKRYSVAKAMNVSVVGSFNAPANITKKKVISASDAFNANRSYNNQEGYRLPNLEEIYHIPSTIRKEWSRMSKAEKIVYGTIFASTVIGLGIAADYKSNDGKTVKKFADTGKKARAEISAGASSFFFGGQPPVAFVGIEAVANETVKATPAPSYDYYDEEFKVGIMIEGDDGFKRHIRNRLDIMKEKTPKLYKEAIDIYKLKPKKIVRSNEKYNYNSEREIGIVVKKIDEDDERKILEANAGLYPEMMGEAPELCKEPKFNNCEQPKNLYENELYQHSNLAKYWVDAGLTTKEQANEWIKGGGWFKNIEERMPTPEDMQGVDVEKYLIK